MTPNHLENVPPQEAEMDSPSMEEITAGAIGELAQKSSQPEDTSSPPTIPDWFQKAYDHT